MLHKYNDILNEVSKLLKFIVHIPSYDNLAINII